MTWHPNLLHALCVHIDRDMSATHASEPQPPHTHPPPPTHPPTPRASQWRSCRIVGIIMWGCSPVPTNDTAPYGHLRRVLHRRHHGGSWRRKARKRSKTSTDVCGCIKPPYSLSQAASGSIRVTWVLSCAVPTTPCFVTWLGEQNLGFLFVHVIRVCSCVACAPVLFLLEVFSKRRKSRMVASFVRATFKYCRYPTNDTSSQELSDPHDR